jgi:hypothetical protein
LAVTTVSLEVFRFLLVLEVQVVGW